MNRNDKALLVLVGVIAIAIYLVHAKRATAQPALSPPVPIPPSHQLPASTGTPECQGQAPNALTDPLGFADWMVTQGACMENEATSAQ